MTQLGVLQDIESDKLLRVHALEAEDLDARTGKAALGRLGGSLHEEHDRRRGDSLVDCGLGLGGQEAGVEDGGEGKGWGADGVQRRGPRDRAEGLWRSVSGLIEVIVRYGKGPQTENAVRENIIALVWSVKVVRGV